MSDTLSTNEVAGMLETDAKTLRKFFRSDKCEIEPVGQGKRYTLTKKDVKSIEKAFNAWNEGKATRASKAEAEGDEPKPKPAPKNRGKAAAAPVEELEDEDLSLDDDEPDDDDLAELEGELEDLDIE